MRRFQWTPMKEHALALSRTGITQQEIAWRLGTTRRTVAGWARRPAWTAKVRELSEASLADWRAKLQGDPAAERAASYERKPRGTRSHRRPWYQHAKTQQAAPPRPEPPIRSQPQRSSDDILADMRRRLERQAAAPKRPWWE